MGTVEPIVLEASARAWMLDAACRDLPTEIFFPPPNRQGAADTKKALAVCRSCPVREACLAYALTFPDRSLPGIWGGETERSRSRMLHCATPIRYRLRKPD